MDVQLPEASLAAAPAGPTVRRRHVRTGSIALVALLAVLAAIAVLPPLLYRLPEPRPIRLTSLQGQVSGTYVAVSGKLFKLVPYADRLPSLPRYLATTGPRPRILVRARQLDVPQAYKLMSWSGDREIPLARSAQDAQTLALRPLAPLAPGYYYVRAARDSAEQAEDYFYFQVDQADTP